MPTVTIIVFACVVLFLALPIIVGKYLRGADETYTLPPVAIPESTGRPASFLLTPPTPEREPTMNIMVGLPGSGKSTLAEWVRIQGWVDEIHSSDQIREELTGRADDLTQDSAVWSLVRSRCAGALSSGLRPLVDATNLSPSARAPYLTLAKLYRAHPVAWLVTTPQDVCMLRNNTRDRNVPGDVMARFCADYTRNCTPEILAAEGWEVVRLDGTSAHHD